MMLNGADIQLERLSKLGDPLERVNAAIDWEIFRALIRKRIRKEDYSQGGRPDTGRYRRDRRERFSRSEK